MNHITVVDRSGVDAVQQLRNAQQVKDLSELHEGLRLEFLLRSTTYSRWYIP